jgi:hypothetical protein
MTKKLKKIIHKAHLHFWYKILKIFAYEIHTTLTCEIIVFTSKCQAWITVADIKW